MTKMLIIPLIADMHWGRPNINQELYFYTMKELFIDKLIQLPVIDIIVICGDYWDRTLKMTDKGAFYGLKFIDEIINLCRIKKCKLRVISGTKSHDHPIMLNYFNFLNSDIDYLGFSTVSVEITNDISILYIPEEYVEDYEKYYNDYLNREYHLIFGHGLIDKASFVSKLQESEMTSLKAPIFKSKDLLKASKGPIFFGHIHKPMNFDERIYYLGSPDRFAFGEEEMKGFSILYYSPIDYSYKIEFIQNENALIYKTLTYTYNLDMNNEEFLERIKIDKETITSNNFLPNIRIKIETQYELNKSLILQLQTLYGKNLIIKNTIKNREELEKDIKTKKLIGEYGFLFDSNVDFQEKISKYLMKKKNIDISPDRIKEILYTKYLK